MAYKFKYRSTQYKMSIRSEPTTAANKIGQLNINVEGFGDEVKNLPNGDSWIKILSGGNAVGWVAVIHNGTIYGTIETIGVVTPPPVVTPTFPESFTLTDPQGNRAEYIFVKVL
jgi:hypothetical protein